MELNGIDVSAWQEYIDWTEVKNHTDFAIIRAGYGKGNIDKRATFNVNMCSLHRIPYGLYWFSYALTPKMAEDEAKNLISFIEDMVAMGCDYPKYPLYFDFEYDSVRYAEKHGVTITPTLLAEIIASFCETLEEAGYYAGVYTNYDFGVNKIPKHIFDSYDVWYANYKDDTSVVPTMKFASSRVPYMWQHSSTGSIEGISGNVDLNKCYLNYPAIMCKNNLNGYKDGTEKWYKHKPIKVTARTALCDTEVTDKTGYTWKARAGDYIVTHADGDTYVVKASVFNSLYEPIE